MVSTLDDTYTYEELARYLTRGHKPRRGAEGAENAKTPRRKGARRWHASRNLTRPVETKRQIARPPNPGEPKARKGYRLLPDWYVGCDRLGYVYSYAAYVAEQLPAGRRAAGRTARAAAGAKRGGGRLAQGRKSQCNSERRKGRDPSVSEPGERAGCLHSMSRPKGGTCELPRARTANASGGHANQHRKDGGAEGTVSGGKEETQ